MAPPFGKPKHPDIYQEERASTAEALAERLTVLPPETAIAIAGGLAPLWKKLSPLVRGGIKVFTENLTSWGGNTAEQVDQVITASVDEAGDVTITDSGELTDDDPTVLTTAQTDGQEINQSTVTFPEANAADSSIQTHSNETPNTETLVEAFSGNGETAAILGKTSASELSIAMQEIEPSLETINRYRTQLIEALGQLENTSENELYKVLERAFSVAKFGTEFTNGQMVKYKRMEDLDGGYLLAASIFHAIKNQFGAIYSVFNELVLEGASVTSDEIDDYLPMIELSLGNISGELESLQVEGAKSKEPLLIALNHFIQERITSREILLADKEISLSMEIPGNLNIHSFPSRIGRILDNLVDNAWQAMEERDAGDSITVSANRINQHLIRISVHDNGLGVPLEDQPGLLNGKKNKSNKPNGSGIGLAGCVHDAEFLGTKLQFESQPGNTLFYFDIADRRAGTDEVTSANFDDSSQHKKGKRITDSLPLGEKLPVRYMTGRFDRPSKSLQ